MVSAYGVREKTLIGSSHEMHAEEIRIRGFTVVPQMLGAAQLPDIRRRLDAVYATQVRESGGECYLQAIDDAGIARCLLAYDSFFMEMLQEPRLLAIVELLLGPHYTLQLQNGVFNRASEDISQQAWHRDLPYQHFVTSRPIAVGALYCVDPFAPHTGGTRVLPGSHKVEAFPSAGYVERNEYSVRMDPGDALVFDAMLYHCAGSNQAANVRRGINHVYTLPFVQQQISLPDCLGPQFATHPMLAQLLGYTSAAPGSVSEWRERRWVRKATRSASNG